MGLSLAGWGAVLSVALASTFGAYLAHGEALRRLDPTRVSIVTVLELVVAGGVAYLWWGERLGLLGWSGAAVILAAALLAVTERGAGASCQSPLPPRSKKNPEPAQHSEDPAAA